MTPTEETSSAASERRERKRTKGRIGRVFSGSSDLVRIVRRDPEHVSERLTLYAVDRLGDSSRQWAENVRAARADTPRTRLAEEQRMQSARIARIDGAISGTPFLLALVSGYLTYLWQEMRMTLRIAALYDHDPRELKTGAAMLALRRVHPDVETAEAALQKIRNTRMPEAPTRRRPLRTWVRSAYLLLVLGGFLSPRAATKEHGGRARLKTILSILLGAAIWITTWVLPATFMIAMAWGCETHTRQLGRRALLYYGGAEASVSAAIRRADRRSDAGHNKRAIVRAVALFLSVAIPFAFLAIVIYVRNHLGVNWLVGVGSLVALSLVIGTVVVSNRR